MINLVPKLDQNGIIEVIRDMVSTVRQLYGPDVLIKRHKLRILITGGGGDFSVALNVRPNLLLKFVLEVEYLNFHRAFRRRSTCDDRNQ